MTEVASGPFCCLVLFYSGILAGIIFVPLELVRLRLNRRFCRHLIDAAMLLLGSASFVLALLSCNGGVLRLYLLLSFLAGILLSYASLFPIFTRKSQKNRKR